MHVYKDGNPHGKNDHLQHWFSMMESFKHEYTSSGCITEIEYKLPITLKKRHYPIHLLHEAPNDYQSCIPP